MGKYGLPALRIVSRTFSIVSFMIDIRCYCICILSSKSGLGCSIPGSSISMFSRDVTEWPAPFDVVGIEVLRLASPEETALPADGTVAKTPELVPYEFKSLLPGWRFYVRCFHSIETIWQDKDNTLIPEFPLRSENQGFVYKQSVYILNIYILYIWNTIRKFFVLYIWISNIISIFAYYI